jgi:hypothetical protein
MYIRFKMCDTWDIDGYLFHHYQIQYSIRLARVLPEKLMSFNFLMTRGCNEMLRRFVGDRQPLPPLPPVPADLNVKYRAGELETLPYPGDCSASHTARSTVPHNFPSVPFSCATACAYVALIRASATIRRIRCDNQKRTDPF